MIDDMDHNTLEFVLTKYTDTYRITSLVSVGWNEVVAPAMEIEKNKSDLYDAFWELRSYARSFYDIDFLPF